MICLFSGSKCREAMQTQHSDQQWDTGFKTGNSARGSLQASGWLCGPISFKIDEQMRANHSLEDLDVVGERMLTWDLQARPGGVRRGVYP